METFANFSHQIWLLQPLLPNCVWVQVQGSSKGKVCPSINWFIAWECEREGPLFSFAPLVPARSHHTELKDLRVHSPSPSINLRHHSCTEKTRVSSQSPATFLAQTQIDSCQYATCTDGAHQLATGIGFGFASGPTAAPPYLQDRVPMLIGQLPPLPGWD